MEKKTSSFFYFFSYGQLNLFLFKTKPNSYLLFKYDQPNFNEYKTQN